jgi:beta-lactamase regulating signal transducer with metallopeptidase domain
MNSIANAFCWAILDWTGNGLVVDFFRILTVVLVGQMIACFSGHAPAFRHCVWRVVFVAILVIVPARFILPPLGFELTAAIESTSRSTGNFLNSDLAARSDRTVSSTMFDASTRQDKSDVESVDQNSVQYAGSLQGSQDSINVAGKERFQRALDWSGEASKNLIVFLPLMIFLVSVWLLMKWISGFVWLSIVSKSAYALDPRLQARVRNISGRLGIRRGVSVRLSRHVCVPLAWGCFRPEVLLPIDFAGWSDKCQESVLAHELSHVARNDTRWDALSYFALALFWFNPAVHFARRQWIRSREESTDWAAIQSGCDAQSYASHLLDVVSAYSSRTRSVATVSMSRYSGLERRIQLIMSHDRLKGPVRRYWIGGITVLTVAIATVQVSSQVPRDVPVVEEETDGVIMEVINPPLPYARFSEAIQNRPLLRKHLHGIKRSFQGSVYYQGNPVQDATVVLRDLKRGAMNSGDQALVVDLIERTKTDEGGNFVFGEIKCPPLGINQSDRAEWVVVASLPDGKMGWANISGRETWAEITDPLKISLLETAPLSGRYVSPDGEPIARAEVRLLGMVESSMDKPEFHLQANLMDNKIMTLANGSLCLATFTDDMGRFHFPEFIQGFEATLAFEHPDWPPVVHQSTGQEQVLVAAPGLTVSGTVMTEDGDPIENAVVTELWPIRSARTDSSGKYQFRIRSDYFNTLPTDTIGGSKSLRLQIGLHPKFESIEILIGQSQIERGELSQTILRPLYEVTGQLLEADGTKLRSKHFVVAQIQDEPSGTILKNKPQLVFTDAEGKFRLHLLRNRYRIFDVGPIALSQLNLGISAFAFPDDESKLKEIARDVIVMDHQIELTPVRTTETTTKTKVTVEVSDEDGKPSSGVQVTLYDYEESQVFNGSIHSQAVPCPLEGPFYSNIHGHVTIQTDKQVSSNALIEAVQNSGQIFKRGSARLIEAGESTMVAIQLKRMAKVSGRILVNGAPATEAHLALHLMPKLTTSPQGVLSYSSEVAAVLSGRFGKLKRDGVYEFIVPPSEGYQIFPEMVNGVTLSNSRSHGASKIVEYLYSIPDLEFATGESEIRGILLDSTDEPLKDYRVFVVEKGSNPPPASWLHPDRASCVTNEHGRFSMNGIPSGLFELWAHHSSEPLYSNQSVKLGGSICPGTEDLKLWIGK